MKLDIHLNILTNINKNIYCFILNSLYKNEIIELFFFTKINEILKLLSSEKIIYFFNYSIKKINKKKIF
jgi:hypothetical protein